MYFGEGITVFGGKLFELTWQNGTAFVYDAKTFQRTGEFHYSGEGWGLTHDDKQLIMSDGTPSLRFLDRLTFKELGTDLRSRWRAAGGGTERTGIY